MNPGVRTFVQANRRGWVENAGTVRVYLPTVFDILNPGSAAQGPAPVQLRPRLQKRLHEFAHVQRPSNPGPVSELRKISRNFENAGDRIFLPSLSAAPRTKPLSNPDATRYIGPVSHPDTRPEPSKAPSRAPGTVTVGPVARRTTRGIRHSEQIDDGEWAPLRHGTSGRTAGQGPRAFPGTQGKEPRCVISRA